MRKYQYVFVLLIIYLAFPALLFAHGGGTSRITKQPMDEYIVSVWSSPTPPVVGKVHLTIALTTAQTPDQPLLNQPVTVTLRSLSADLPLITAFATNEQSVNRLLYETDVDLPQDGRWQVELLAGHARTPLTFELEVAKAQSIPLWLLLLLGVGVISGVGFLVAKNRKNQ